MSLKSSQSESSLLYSQAKNLFEKAKIAIDSGTLRTETQLVYEVFSAFNAFFESVGKQNLVVRHAPEGGPPWSEDYNSMMDEIKADLEMLYAEVELIGQTLYTDFNHNTVQHDALNVRYNDVLDRMKDLELYSGIANNMVQFANEEFLNSDKIDFSRSSLKAADISNGVASLPIKSRVNISPESEVSIITGNAEAGKYIIGSSSNGFPGNNTEIHTVTDGILTTQKYTPTFVGDQNNHGNYASVIDNNANTWFEYEKVSIREHDKVTVAKNLGWNYQVDGSTMVEFVGEPTNGTLRLQMQIVLPQESVINQIFFNMYTPPNYGAKTAKIKDILVTDGRVPPYSIIPEGHNREGYNYSFDPVSAKIVYVQFEQPEKYATDIGHIYYEKTSASQRTGDYALGNEINASKYAQRIDGPAISLSSLGVRVERNSTKISAEYPLMSAEQYEDTALSGIVNELSSSIEDRDADIGIEKFEGWRWCIGIRDIEIYSCEYEDEGEIVSKPFLFDKPVEKITLEANEILPASVLNDYQTKYDYLSYFVSIDDGGNWHPITPMSHEIISEEQPPKIYTVRTVGSDSMKLTNKNAYLESETPVYSLRVKVVIKKPETFSTFSSESIDTLKDRISPVLESYTLSIMTEGNVLDSKESLKLINATDIGTTEGENEPDDETDPPEDPENPPGLTDCDPTDPLGDCYEGPPIIDDCNPDDPNSECYSPPDEGGESPGGSDKIRVVIDDNPIERKKFCLGETTIIEGSYNADNNVDKLELYFNGILIETQEIFNTYGPTKEGRYEFEITSEILETYFTATANGANFSIYVYAHDVLGNWYRAHMISKFVDCEAESNADKRLRLVVNQFKNVLCLCNDLKITGRAISGLAIDPNNVRIEINEQAVDFRNLGTPIEDPCNPNDGPESIPDEQVPEIEIVPENTGTQIPESEMDNIEGYLIMAHYKKEGIDHEFYCVPPGATSIEVPVRICFNHPIKNYSIIVNGEILTEKQFTFNDMMFDDMATIRLDNVQEGDVINITARGNAYFGYENRTLGFTFHSFNFRFEEHECEDPFTKVSGVSPIAPSSFYNNTNAYIDVPFYALGGETPETFKMLEVVSDSIEDTIFSVQNTGTTNSVVEFNINIPYWKLLELGCTPNGTYRVKFYVNDAENELTRTYLFHMRDCVGDPQVDNNIRWIREKMTCLVCECEDLIVKGQFTSLEQIQNIGLTINGITVNPIALGEPTNNPCNNNSNGLYSISGGVVNIGSKEVMQADLEIRIPYWKLLELGCVPNGQYLLRLNATTANSNTGATYRFTVRNDCNDNIIRPNSCTVCENEDCVQETTDDRVTLRIQSIDRFPCQCENVKVKGYVSSTIDRINKLEVTINGVEINPYDLGPVFPSICDTFVPPDRPEPPVDEVKFITFMEPSHETICNDDNTFRTKVSVETPEPIKKLFIIWRSNGVEILRQEVDGVEGSGQLLFEAGFPAYNIALNGTTETIPMYFDAGNAELEIELQFGTQIQKETYSLTITECAGIVSDINYSNNVSAPNKNISFLNDSSLVDTRYWHGVHQAYTNIANEYWKGRNDWLALLGNMDAQIDVSEPFWDQLYRLFKDYIANDQLVLPEPFAAFETWWKANMTKFIGDTKVDRAMRGTVYATYKMKQITIVYPGTEKELAVLNNGKLEELAKFITLTPRYTYHWIDFRDIESSSGTLAWVNSADHDFLAYMNIEESVFDSGVFSLNAHRHKNYTVNADQDFGLAKYYDNVDESFNVVNQLIGSSSFERLLFRQEEEVGLLVGGETVVHEVGHAIAYYAIDAYPEKYVGQNRAFHDWDEWRNISGWPLFTNKEADDVAIPYTAPDGTATVKFSKTSSTNQLLANGKEAPVSPYGCRHPSEDFAEAYAMYRINPGLLQALYPKKYEFMESWIKDMPKNTDRVTVFNAVTNKAFTLNEGDKTSHICNCREKVKAENKKPVLSLNLFHYEILPPSTYHEFNWTIPYWKLLQIGCQLGKSYTVRVRAFTEDGERKRTVFSSISLKDCTVGPDEPPYEDACHETESVIIHYYNAEEDAIKEEIIPLALLPYQIDNGAGTIARICLRDTGSKGVSVEIIESGDESGYAFQLHAVGVNYYQYGNTNDIRTVWARSVYGQLGSINPNLMLGDPVGRTADTWLSHLRIGNYEKAPSLEGKGSRIYFNMPQEYKLYKCKNNIECGKIVRPTPTGKTCNDITHFLVQYYSIQSRGLRITKIPIKHYGSNIGEYRLDDNTVIKVVWHSELKGIAIQVIQAANDKSVILTAAGIMFKRPDGVSETQWSEALRFYSNRAQNPEFILGAKKKMSDLTFISNGVIDYDNASYVGGEGDYVVVKANEQVTQSLCNIPTQPPLTIDDNLLHPKANFLDLTICEGSGYQFLEFEITDYTAVKEAIYSVILNDVEVLYNRVRTVFTGNNKTESVVFEINATDWVVGDKIEIFVESHNILGGSREERKVYTVSYCDVDAPEIVNFSPVIMPVENGIYCYDDLRAGEYLPVNIHVEDDRAIGNISIDVDQTNVLNENFSTSNLITSTEGEVRNIRLPLPDKLVDTDETTIDEMVKADIIFIFDTSGSMSDEINNVRTNLEKFKDELIAENIDAHFGYVDSRFATPHDNKDLTPSHLFDLDDVVLNNGGWENLNWRQLTDYTHGGLYFLNQFRPGAERIFIVVTDATITNALTENIIAQMVDNNITVHFVNKEAHSTNASYNTLMERTNGERFNIDSPEFGLEMKNLAYRIIYDTTMYYPDKTFTITITGTDTSGNSSTKELELTFTDCRYNNLDGGYVSNDEVAVENEYSLLIRSKWGATPRDLDLYVFVDNDTDKMFYYGYPTDDTTIPNVRTYYKETDASGNIVGEIWLNKDYTTHSSDAQFETEYEIMTIKGFPNRRLTIMTHIFNADGEVGESRPPTLEIVDKNGVVIRSITKNNVEWLGHRTLRVIDFNTNAQGDFLNENRGPAFVSAIDPTL